jgi:hypothetical protein
VTPPSESKDLGTKKRWLVVATLVAIVAAALVVTFDLVSGSWARAAIVFPIALVAAVCIVEFGPDLKPMVHRGDRVANAIELAAFGSCLIAGIVASNFAASADEAARYIGYFITLVAAKYVSEGIGTISTRGRSARGDT